jgi:RNA polymerase sigma factor (sigma-70 family)
MAVVPLTHVLKRVHALAVHEESDRQLLERFAGNADEAAFAGLVRRHGSLVLGVCRRVLGAGPDAEDAFQAAFLVLAQKARSIRKHASVASWLYGVAYRLALQVRTKQARRRRHEAAARRPSEVAATSCEPVVCASLRELGAILDQELERLPARYREAMVLCHLEGLSHAEAARQLGWPLGTFKGRVQRAHTLLRKRLERRGVTLSAIALASVLGREAGAAITPALREAAIRCASSTAIPARVAALAQGAAHALAATKLKFGAGVALTVVMLALAVGAAPFDTTEALPPARHLQDVAAAQDMHGDPLPAGAALRIGTVRFRHGAAVTFAALLPDGQHVVSAANDRYVRIWDRASGRELHRMGPGPRPAPVSDVYVTVRGRPASTVAAVSADGTRMATHFDGPGIQLWDAATGADAGSVPLPSDTFVVALLAFAPSGSHLAIAGTDGTIHLWDLKLHQFAGVLGEPGAQLKAFVSDQVAVVYAPDGKTVASMRTGEVDMQLEHHVRFWDPTTRKLRHELRAPAQQGMQSGTFSPDSKLFAYAEFGEIVVLDAASGKELRRWKVGLLTITAPLGWPALAFAADSTRLFAATAARGAIREYDVRTGKELRRLAARGGQPMTIPSMVEAPACLAIAPDGKTLALGDRSHTLRFVDAVTGKEEPAADAPAHSLTQVAYAPDGKSLLTRADLGVRRWDLSNGKPLGRIAVPAGAFRLVVSDNGRFLAAEMGGGDMAVHNVANGKKLFTVAGEGNSFSTCFFSASGNTLLVRRVSETVAVLHDVATGKERRRLPIADTAQHGALAVDPENVQLFLSADAERLAVSSLTRPLTIIDVVTGRIVLETPFGRGPLLRSVVFAPDGRTVALDAADGVVRLLELATGQERCRFGKPLALSPGDAKPKGAVTIRGSTYGLQSGGATIAFSPDGRLLAHAEPGAVAQVWDVATGRSLARLTGHTGPIGAIALAPDGDSVATGSADTTALVWDVRGLRVKAGPPPRVLGASALRSCWDELAEPVTSDAINALVGSPREAVELLRVRIRPAPPVDAARLARLLEKLDSDDFEMRQEAETQLGAMGEQLAPFLPKALSQARSLEARRRLEALKQLWTKASFTGERLRVVRAIEVLERIGSPEARTLLQALADGAPAALITTEAEAALRRLTRGSR